MANPCREEDNASSLSVTEAATTPASNSGGKLGKRRVRRYDGSIQAVGLNAESWQSLSGGLSAGAYLVSV